MSTISRIIKDTERRAQALLADLIPLVGESEVAQDPEFVAYLEKALEQAQSKLAVARTESGQFKTHPVKQTPDKPHESSGP